MGRSLAGVKAETGSEPAQECLLGLQLLWPTVECWGFECCPQTTGRSGSTGSLCPLPLQGLPPSRLQGGDREGAGRPYQAEERFLLLRTEVQAGEGQQHVAEVGHGDALGPAEDVLGTGRRGGRMKCPRPLRLAAAQNPPRTAVEMLLKQ